MTVRALVGLGALGSGAKLAVIGFGPGPMVPPLEHRADAPPPVRPASGAPTQAAVMAYSRAVLYADRGDRTRAIEQYNRALTAFPQYTQARTECNRLQAGACGS